MNLGYRIVHGILALAVFPAFFFLQLFYIEVSPSFLDYGMSAEVTLKRLWDLIGGKDEIGNILNGEGSILKNFMECVEDFRGTVIAFITFLALSLIIALVIVVICFVTKKKLVYLTASSIGLACTIGFMVCFSVMSKQFTTGNVNIANLFSASYLASFAGSLLNVDKLVIGGFANGILILYIAMVLWTGIYLLTELGAEEPGKKAPAAAPAKKKKK